MIRCGAGGIGGGDEVGNGDGGGGEAAMFVFGGWGFEGIEGRVLRTGRW